MKRAMWLGTMLIICLLCGGCKNKKTISNTTMSISEDAMVQEAFYMGNQLYTIRTDGNMLCLLAEEIETVNDILPEGITLVEMRADGDGTAKWWASQEKIVITKGSAVYLYDISNNSSEMIWEMEKSKDSNCVNVPCMGEEWIILQENYGTKNTGVDSAYVPYVYNTKEYSALNVMTGEVKTLFTIQGNDMVLAEGNSATIRTEEVSSMESGAYISRPEMICMEGENLYFLMEKNDQARATEAIAVLRANLRDMSITELGTYEGSKPFNAKGFVYEEALYFSENTYGIYSVSIEGGEVSFVLPNSQYYLIADMQKKEDSTYLVLLNGTTNPDSLICSWNPETNETKNINEPLFDLYSVFWTGESFCIYYTSRGVHCCEYKQ